MIHQIPLTSSRCQIATSPCMNFLAVASNANGSDEKGTIDVWNLKEKKTQHHQQYDDDDDDDDSSGMMESSTSTRIEAHDDNQKIRGLHFVTVNDDDNSSSFSESDGPTHWIVSCTLQGEVKFFKYDENQDHLRMYTQISKSRENILRGNINIILFIQTFYNK